MEEQIESDLKAALLAGNKHKVETLRGLKSSILNEAIAAGVKDKGLSAEQIQKVLVRESKKRSEAAELYQKAGSSERADAELSEKHIIDSYLPKQADEAEVAAEVEAQTAKLDNPSQKDMGTIIGAVRAKFGASADGAMIARLVKEKLGL